MPAIKPVCEVRVAVVVAVVEREREIFDISWVCLADLCIYLSMLPSTYYYSDSWAGHRDGRRSQLEGVYS
jgi:hypothetical protein